MPAKRVLEYQKANGAWLPLGLFSGEKSGVIMAAPSGGGLEYTDQFARDFRDGGKLVVIDTFESGTPAPWTFTLEMPFTPAKFVEKIFGFKNLRVRWYEGEYSVPTNYLKMLVYADSKNQTEGFNNPLIDDTTNQGNPDRRTLAQRAATMIEVDKVEHVRVASALTDEPVNCVISLGIPESTTNDEGDLEFVAGTDLEAAATPKLLYTDDVWETGKELACTGLSAADITGLARAGANLVIAASNATGGGLFYVNLDDVRSEASAVTPTRSTGVAAGDEVFCVVALNANLVLAGGESGAVYKSTDGGRTFSTLVSGASNNFISVAAYDETLVIFGGSSGECYKYKNGVFSALTVTGISTANCNSVAIPPRKRGDDIEIYIGASDGDVYRSLDEGVSWSTPAFDSSGSGAVDGLVFAGHKGSVLYVIQTNGSSKSRILRDFSGGNLGQDVEIIGSFASPADNVINAIVAPKVNKAVCVGELLSTTGYIGVVA